jgi:hypothetical protein
MMATRWFFYYFTVEKCFGVPMHLGLDSKTAVAEFCRILRLGLLPRSDSSDSIKRPPGLGAAKSLRPKKGGPS